MKAKFKNLDELFNKYPWRTPNKFIPLANKYGFKNKSVFYMYLKI